MTCRDEILKTVEQIIEAKGANEFTIMEVLYHMMENATLYKESTIRTHITSRLCKNAPKHHAVKHDDLERIGEGTYKLLKHNLLD